MDLKEGIPMIGNLLETWNQIKDRREDRRMEVRRKLQPYVSAVRDVVGGRWPSPPTTMQGWGPVPNDVQQARQGAVGELNLSRSDRRRGLVPQGGGPPERGVARRHLRLTTQHGRNRPDRQRRGGRQDVRPGRGLRGQVRGDPLVV